MCGTINWMMFLIVNPLDDIRLLSDAGVWENGVGGGQSFEIGFERTYVNGRSVRGIFVEIECGRDFLHPIESGELPHAHTHGVTRMNETVRAGLNAAVSAVGISRRP